MSFFYKQVTEKDYWGKEHTETMFRKGRAIAIGVAAAIVLLVGALSIARVPTGHTGVVTSFGKVQDYTLDAGMHLKAPWHRIVKMDNRVQKQTIALSCFSSDIQEVSMVFTVNYQINKANAMTIYSTIGKNYYETVVSPTVMESIKVVAAKYTAEALIEDRNALGAGIESDLSEKLRQYNIELVGTSIEDMDFTDVFTTAVEAKQVAAQNKLKAQTEAEQAVIEAEAKAKQRVIETTAEAEAQKIEAEAEAYGITVKAEAEADANKKLAESITDELNQYRYYDVWDGQLPKFVTGESGTFFQMPTE